jgi:phosphatidylserine decarboxylase
MNRDYNETQMMTHGISAYIVRWFFLCRLPLLSTAIIWLYASYFQANFYGHKLKDFDCLLSFFLRTRDLSAKMRGQDLISGYVSPVEATIQYWGKLSHNNALPIKGAGFTVAKLLGFEAPHFVTGIVLYLPPGNYHHVHAPVDMVVEDYIELPGHLLALKENASHKNPMIYCENYRHVIVARSHHGERFALVLVGAKHIGSIACPKLAGFEKGKDVGFEKGEEIGFFSLGSSVVLLSDRSIPMLKNIGDCIDVIDVLFDEGGL